MDAKTVAKESYYNFNKIHKMNKELLDTLGKTIEDSILRARNLGRFYTDILLSDDFVKETYSVIPISLERTLIPELDAAMTLLREDGYQVRIEKRYCPMNANNLFYLNIGW